MKTIIAKNSYHQEIKEYLLRQNDCEIAEIITLEAFLDKYIFDFQDDSLYKYYDVLKDKDLYYFKDSVKKVSFLEEIKNFIVEMKQFGLNVNDLLDNDDYLKELKQIISTVFDIELKIDYQKKVISNLSDLNNVYIIDKKPSYFERQTYDELISKGAKYYSDDSGLNRKKEYYNYLNKRCEIEGLARYLIKNNIDLVNSKITLLDNTYIPFIKQVFKRYKIPFNFISDNKTPRLVHKYISLIKYYINATHDNLLNLVSEEVFSSLGEKANNAFYQYTKLFGYNITDDYEHIKNNCISDDILNHYEIEDLLKLEEDALILKSTVYDDLMVLRNQSNIIEAIKIVDDVICKYNYCDSNILYKIRDKVLKAQKYLNVENIDILYEDLKRIKANVNDKFINGITILSSTEMCISKSNHFILGASNDNFPGFKTHEGIFSETYLEKINYPKLVDRYALFMQNQLNNLNSEFLYVSKSISSFDGKEKKSALEIDEFMQMDPKYIDIKFPNKPKSVIGEEKINSEIAKKLFFKDQIIKGSVSSMEQFSNCPFSYFLDKGLGLKEKTNYEYNSAKNGTLIHYVLEKLVNQYQDDFVDVNQEEVEKIIDTKLDEIILFYPNLAEQFKLVKKRLLQLVMVNLGYLKDLDQYSKLTSYKQEYEFNDVIEVDGTKLKLKGFIDRIKANNDFIQIIDYKSSKKRLVESKFLQGQQLQLLTYALILKKIYNDKRILGAYYYNFKLNSIKGSYAKRSRGEVIVNDQEEYLKQLKKEHKYSGWTFEPYYELIGGDKECVDGISVNKDGSLSSRSHIYDLDVINKALLEIYKMLIDDIKDGIISIKPNDCTYCCYKNICHYPYNGGEDKKTLELEEELYRKDLNV